MLFPTSVRAAAAATEEIVFEELESLHEEADDLEGSEHIVSEKKVI